MEGESSVTVGRDDYRSVQTPQVFDAELLKAAYEIMSGDWSSDVCSSDLSSTTANANSMAAPGPLPVMILSLIHIYLQ